MKYLASVGCSMGAFAALLEILITYVRKKKVKTLQNNFFIVVTVFCLFLCLSEFAYAYCISIKETLSNTTILIPCIFFIFFSIFGMYFTICYVIAYRTANLEDKKRKKIRAILFSIFFVIYLACFLVACNTEIIIHDDFLYQFDGPAINVVSGICYVLFLFAVIALFVNNKSLSRNQRLPLLFAVIAVLVIFASQLVTGYDFNYLSYLLALLLAAIFFTTENQDFKLLEELEESKKTAEEENVAQAKFVDNISREIKGPLNNIIGLSNIMISEEEYDFESIKKDVSKIHEASMSLLKVTNYISDISQIESGKEKVEEKEYLLSELVDDIYWVISRNFVKDDVEFSINVDEKLPSKYYGDVEKIQKIITNTLINAFYHTTNGKVSLDIHGAERKDKSIVLEILVFNTGHLMSEEDFSKELQDFAGSDNSISVDDNAMALMVAKRLLTMLDGEIKFVNEAGKGTRYYITLKQLIVDPTPVGKLENSLYTIDAQKKELDSSNNSSLEVSP